MSQTHTLTRREKNMHVDIHLYICKITIILTGNEKSMDYILMTLLYRQNVFLAIYILQNA